MKKPNYNRDEVMEFAETLLREMDDFDLATFVHDNSELVNCEAVCPCYGKTCQGIDDDCHYCIEEYLKGNYHG